MPPAPDLGLLSLLPVVVSIALALWTRRVVLSLLAGLAAGALLLAGGNPLRAAGLAIDPFLLDALSSRDNVKVVLFSLLIAATIGVIGEAGGTRALVEALAARARTRRAGMVAAWLSGMVVFFDDYANCLIVGGAMRPVTDRLRISREKLAFIVDSTAAPVATVALVSTWVGFEVGLIDKGLQAAGPAAQAMHGSAYGFFMAGLPYRFYPLLMILMTGLVCASGRDFGPMLRAERAALASARGPAPAPAQARGNLWLAVIPIGALVVGTVLSIGAQGLAAAPAGAPLFEIVGAANGYDAMLHGSALGLALAVGLTWATGALPGERAGRAAFHGMQELVQPLAVLALAWSLGDAVEALKAADALISLLGPGFPGWALPAATFTVAAGIAFATGTSFGTMTILMPLAIPLAFQVDPAVAVATTSAVLSGATWGDHCSPISDTTVLSSTGAGCEHGAHVETQLPYALAVGLVSLLACSVPAGFGAPAALCLGLGAAATAALVYGVGRPVEPEPRSP